MKRRSINLVTITLYIILALGALVFGYLEHMVQFKAWIGIMACLALMLILGIVRAALLKADNKKTIQANTVRVVNVQETQIKGEQDSNVTITDKLPLVHVDSVNEKQVVVSLHKDKSLLSDSISKVVR